MTQRHPRLIALLFTLLFFGLIWMYVLEFPVLSNTIGVRWLVIGSMVTGTAICSFLLWRLRARFSPAERHLPEILFILLSAVLFSPLFGSILNRTLGSTDFQSFEFVSETAYFASGYGFLKGEKLQPTGYRLYVLENGKQLSFKYKSQAYYPLTKRRETVMLPVRNGLFGARVMLLR